MNYIKNGLAALAFVGVCTFGYNRVTFPERVAATGIILEEAVTPEAGNPKSPPPPKRNSIPRETWEEVLDNLSAATREWMRRKYEDAPMTPNSIEDMFLEQMPSEYGQRMSISEEEIELGTDFWAEIRLKFEYDGIVPGRISLDYELNAVRVAFRLPGEMETADSNGEVVQNKELVFRAIDRYTLPNVWRDLFPLFDEHAAQLNESFGALLRNTDLRAFEEERKRLSVEYTGKICRLFDFSGAILDGTDCAEYRP